jgi:hypothetical protein
MPAAADEPPAADQCGAIAGRRRRAGLGTADIGGNVVVMSFAPVPVTAAWYHRGARSGFEVACFGGRGDRCQIEGWTTAIEEGATWAVEYVIEVDAAGATRSAAIRGRSAAGFCSALLEADGQATGWSTADPRDSWTAAWTWTWRPRR